MDLFRGSGCGGASTREYHHPNSVFPEKPPLLKRQPYSCWQGVYSSKVLLYMEFLIHLGSCLWVRCPVPTVHLICPQHPAASRPGCPLAHSWLGRCFQASAGNTSGSEAAPAAAFPAEGVGFSTLTFYGIYIHFYVSRGHDFICITHVKTQNNILSLPLFIFSLSGKRHYLWTYCNQAAIMFPIKM